MDEVLGVSRKTAIVTGGGRGIGRAISFGLVRAGFDVVVADLDRDCLDEVSRNAPRAFGHGSLLPVRADISDADAVDRLVLQAVAAFGGVDVVVNNAGPTQTAVRPFGNDDPILFSEVSPDMYRLFLEVHVMGPFLLVNAALPHMRRKGWGRIITVTTSLSTMIAGGRLPYGPAKAANEAQMSVMAHDLAGTGVTVNVVVPGAGVDTRNTRKIQGESGAPSNLQSPEIMVPPVLMIAADGSQSITGQRFVATRWDTSLTDEDNIKVAGAPLGWPGLQSLVKTKS